jgi:hypothetical protein
MSKESNRLKKWGLLFFIFYLDPIEEIDELSGKKVKAFEVGKNIVMLSPVNWEEYATLFMEQRFNLKKREKGLSGITKDEFCKLELEYISQIIPNQEEIEILFGRYKTLLNATDSNRVRGISYIWKGNSQTDLPVLFRLMKDNELISSQNTYEQFERVFSGEPLDQINPIRWGSNNTTELLYFLHRLQDADFIKMPKRADYNQLVRCFVQADSNDFEGEFKVLKKKAEQQTPKSRAELFDTILQEIM